MNKIPVGKVISGSVNLAFRNYLSLLGVVWLPVSISLLLSWLVLLPQFRADAAGSGGLHPASSALISLAYEFVQLALMAVMSVGVTRVALGVREGPRFVYLSVGATELRVFGGYLLLAIITLGLCLVLGLVVGLAVVAVTAASGAGSGSGSAAVARAIAIGAPLGVFGILLPLLYFFIRLSSFQTAVSVVENRFGLWRSWALSRGNFWRLFAIVMVIWVPLLILYAVVLSFTLGPAYLKMIAAAASGPEALRAAQQELMASTMGNFKYFALLGIPLAPIIQALIVAPGAFAYRALVPAAIDPAATFD